MPHWALDHIAQWEETWGIGQDQGFGNLCRRYYQEAQMANRVKGRLIQDGGPNCGVPGIPRYRGGVGANPDDVWAFSRLEGQEHVYPQTTALVKRWMTFLRHNRPPRAWCRTSPGVGYLYEEGHGSTVLYQKGANAPQWLQDQGDGFSRLLRYLDARAMVGGRHAQDYGDAAQALSEPGGAESNLQGHFAGTFGKGGPGANATDVLVLILQSVEHAEDDNEVDVYIRKLNPRVTPFDITNTSPGAEARRTHAWFNKLMPAYNRLMRSLDSFDPRGWPAATLDKAARLRQIMNRPDGVVLPGRARMLRGAPGVPPIDLRDWFQGENVHGGGRTFPDWYGLAQAYLDLVVQTWEDVPRFIRHSGGCSSAQDPETHRPYAQDPRTHR